MSEQLVDGIDCRTQSVDDLVQDLFVKLPQNRHPERSASGRGVEGTRWCFIDPLLLGAFRPPPHRMTFLGNFEETPQTSGLSSALRSRTFRTDLVIGSHT